MNRKLFIGVAIAAIVTSAAVSTVLAHNLVVNATINPPDGTTITTSSVALSGTFGNSGCGLSTAIDVVPSSGVLSNYSQSCVDGLWSWSATWSGFDYGTQTVEATFYATHSSTSQAWVHEGRIEATYYVTGACDSPAAPAIANRYLRELGVSNQDPRHGSIISAVAHAMNNGEFGDSPCDEGYAEAVRAFVDDLLP